jgi:hypothetical protein
MSMRETGADSRFVYVIDTSIIKIQKSQKNNKNIYLCADLGNNATDRIELPISSSPLHSDSAQSVISPPTTSEHRQTGVLTLHWSHQIKLRVLRPKISKAIISGRLSVMDINLSQEKLDS